MKKLITLSLLIASFAFTATFASAQTYNQQNDRYDRRDDRRNDRDWRGSNRGVRVETRTRIVRQGYRTFRETIQIKRFPNGKVTTKVVSRTRIR